jgi:hypothetical protein
MTQAVERQKSILEIVENLTPQQQEEVLNFIEFLQFKSQKYDIDAKGKSQQKSPEELGWPPGFFEQTYGSASKLCWALRRSSRCSSVIEERLLYGYYAAKSRCGFDSEFHP